MVRTLSTRLSLILAIQKGTATLKNSLAISNKAKHTLSHDLAIPPLGIYPREMCALAHKGLTLTFLRARK